MYSIPRLIVIQHLAASHMPFSEEDESWRRIRLEQQRLFTNFLDMAVQHAVRAM